MGRPLLIAILACAGACYGGEGEPILDPGPDGGVQRDAGPDGSSPAPPAAPAAAVLTPCPDGWSEIAAPEASTTCEPWPQTGPEDCSPDSAHFPGEPGCRRVGTECPKEEWPEALPLDGEVYYVRASGAAGGAGTQESPFGTIEEAVRAAETGSVIALGRGTFDEDVLLPGGVTLVGACVADTLVASSAPSDTAGSVTVTGTESTVKNLRVSGRRPGVVVLRAGSVHLEDVVIDGAYGTGWSISGGRATALHVVVRDTRSRANDGHEGIGLSLDDGAEVEASHLALERNRYLGIAASGDGTTLRLTDVVVRGTQTEDRPQDLGFANGLAAGLGVDAGAEVEVSRGVFERNRTAGVLAKDVGTTLRMADVVVRDTEAQEVDGNHGYGIVAWVGAHAEVSRALVAANRYYGVIASEAGSTLRLEDVVVRDTRSAQVDDSFGSGVVVYLAEAETTRTVLESNRLFGVWVFGGTLRATDLVVRDTRSQPWRGESRVTELPYTLGLGLAAMYAADVEIGRALFERNRAGGAYADGLDTRLTLTDVVVRETLASECAADTCPGFGFGVGVGAHHGASVEARRFAVTHSGVCGVQVALDGTMDLHEGEVAYSPIGANVQTEGFDLGRLEDRVRYHDNDRNLDSANLPLPFAEPPDL